MRCIVHAIKSIDYCKLLKSMPPMLSTKVTGVVPTPGWSKAELSPWVYLVQPSDGVQDFTMSAESPPEGDGLADVLTDIAAEPKPFFVPHWIKGVRIHSSTNKMEFLFGAKGADAGDGDPFPLRKFMPWLSADAAK